MDLLDLLKDIGPGVMILTSLIIAAVVTLIFLEKFHRPLKNKGHPK